MKLADVLDPSLTPSLGYAGLLREALSLLAFPAEPKITDIDGAGHVVLVIPAFLSGDRLTRPLHRYLARCGYRAFGWGLGINWGPTPRLLAGLRARLTELVRLEQDKVSVVGVSLGGLLARDLAHDRPEEICQVVTLGAPCRLPTATTIAPLFHLTAPFYAPTIDLARVSRPLPVPTTSIYSSEDGIIAWQTCRDERAGVVAIDVGGTHFALGRNPRALRATAARLQAARREATRGGPRRIP